MQGRESHMQLAVEAVVLDVHFGTFDAHVGAVEGPCGG